MGVDEPAEPRDDASNQDEDHRAEAVDEGAFDRDEPYFERYEELKRPLDVGVAPAVGVLHHRNEIRPAVLIVGDRGHADDAGDQLNPGVGAESARDGRRRSRLSCQKTPLFKEAATKRPGGIPYTLQAAWPPLAPRGRFSSAQGRTERPLRRPQAALGAGP